MKNIGIFIIVYLLPLILNGQDISTVLNRLKAGEKLEIDWVQQQYLLDGGSEIGECPLFPDQMLDGEGELHATLYLEWVDDNHLKIEVVSFYFLLYPVRYFTDRNFIFQDSSANYHPIPYIVDTRYNFDGENEMSNFSKRIQTTPILLKNGHEIVNVEWFEILNTSNSMVRSFFNKYNLQQMVSRLLGSNWMTKENYRLLTSETTKTHTIAHFVRPQYPAKKTVIKGVIEYFYNPKIQFYNFNQRNAVSSWNIYKEVEMDSSGQFRLEVAIDEPVFLKLYHGLNDVIRLYVEPGDSLEVSSFFRKTIFSGDNAISNQVLLELFHDIRSSRINQEFSIKGHGIKEKFEQLNKDKQTELAFLTRQKEKLSPSFYQFLERHILFWNAERLLESSLSYHRYSITYNKIPDYLGYINDIEELRKYFIRLPESEDAWVLLSYLDFHYLLLKGMSSLGLKRGYASFDFFNLGKLVFAKSPDNLFRLGDLTLFNNSGKQATDKYMAFYKKMQAACLVTDKKQDLRIYLDSIGEIQPIPLIQSLSSMLVPNWSYTLKNRQIVSMKEHRGDYLVLHIGLAKNLEAAKSDIKNIKTKYNRTLKTLNIVATEEASLRDRLIDEVLYISNTEMLRLRDSFLISDNANNYFLIDPNGKVLADPNTLNSYSRLVNAISDLPTSSKEKKWQPTPKFWQNLGILSLVLFLVTLIYVQRKRILAKREQQHRQMLELELKGIRAQMNPHFLFNALSSIQNLIRKKDEQGADKYLTQFAGLVRKILRNSEQEFITLEEELSAINQYCSLESLRTPFNYEIKIAEEIDAYNTYIPGMLIQPLVENAILHGLAPKQGQGNLWINILPHLDGLNCEIIDNGLGLKQSQRKKQNPSVHQKSYGLSLVKQRLTLLQNQPQKTFLTIEDRSNSNPSVTGTIAQLIIPIEK